MARIETLEEKYAQRTSRHGKVDATFHVFEEGGEIFLQIDTYGSSGREITGKVSQSIQLGRVAREQIKAILEGIQD